MEPLVVESLSPKRIEAYVLAADGDLEPASALHVWSARDSASFFLPLQCAEVCFRNKVAAAIAASYSTPWWLDPRLHETFSPGPLETLLKTLERIERRGQVTGSDQVTASVTFGFWVTLLKGVYSPPVWSRQLRQQFPDLPQGASREKLRQLAQTVLHLRSRISHHEPVVRLDLPTKHDEVTRLIAWMCPATHDWLQPHLTFDQVFRERP